MAIQFFCVACRQPIEVDDDMANQTVTCPYCRKVVTAPASTEAGVQNNPPVARTTDAIEPPGPLPSIVAPPRSSGTLSWVALGCTSVSMIIYAILIGTAISIAKGVAADTDPAEAQKIVAQEVQSRPGLQALSIVGSCVLPPVGIVTGIVALVRRAQPRWPAVTALVVYGLIAIVTCLGLLFTISAAAGAKSGG